METHKLLVIGSGYLLIIISLIPLIRKDYWIFRIFEYPRLQKLVVNVALLAYLISDLNPEARTEVIATVLLGLNMFYLLYQVVPFTVLGPKQIIRTSETDPDKQIALFIGNVFQDNKKAMAYLTNVLSKDPDVIMLVETNKWWVSQLGSLSDNYPYQLSVPMENTYGMLLLSKFKLRNGKVKFLVEKDIPSVHASIELPSGDLLNFHGLHPTPPVPNENPRSTERDKEILLVGKEAKKSKLPVIVAGDLNDVAWSYTTELFCKISGLLDLRKGRGFFNTFHAKYFILRFPLDHIFCSEDFTLVEIERLPNCGSDHFPMFVRLQYSPEKAASQKKPEPGKENKKTAQEKINKPT